MIRYGEHFQKCHFVIKRTSSDETNVKTDGQFTIDIA